MEEVFRRAWPTLLPFLLPAALAQRRQYRRADSRKTECGHLAIDTQNKFPYCRTYTWPPIARSRVGYWGLYVLQLGG